jgi:NAD(P)-dependent dehydrogenase (short-subunit alcohol dehydrogenase family)
MKQIIVVTGASGGFGRMAAQELAKARHTIYAGIRETAGRNAPQVATLDAFVAKNGVNVLSAQRSFRVVPRARQSASRLLPPTWITLFSSQAWTTISARAGSSAI